MIKLTDEKGNPIYFPVDIAFRPKGNGTEIKWNGSLFTVKESHDEISEKMLDFRDKRRRKHATKKLNARPIKRHKECEEENELERYKNLYSRDTR